MTRLSQYCVLMLALCVSHAQSEPPSASIHHNDAAHASSAPASIENVLSAARSVTRIGKPVEAIDRVLIISIDGLRPDLLLRANTPRMRLLCAEGSFSFWAETTPEAYTLPCHVSMLTGAPAEKHGVTWNEYIEQSYPNVPTLFEVAKRAGFTTAMATGKMKFIVFTRPGALDDYYYPAEEPVSDDEVAIHASGLLRKVRPNVMFVHLPGVDTVGHDFGWGSREQMAAIEKADQAVGRVMAVLASLQLDASTLVILTADHGGAAKNHEMNDPRSRFIPWIACGPGVRKDFDLTLLNDRTIRIEDTFSTACAFLGLEPGSENQGRPVLEILETPTSNQ
jgi:predicted AlkP superfamily pyrophosphatase or phosphodiesterase